MSLKVIYVLLLSLKTQPSDEHIVTVYTSESECLAATEVKIGRNFHDEDFVKRCVEYHAAYPS